MRMITVWAIFTHLQALSCNLGRLYKKGDDLIILEISEGSEDDSAVFLTVR